MLLHQTPLEDAISPVHLVTYLDRLCGRSHTRRSAMNHCELARLSFRCSWPMQARYLTRQLRVQAKKSPDLFPSRGWCDASMQSGGLVTGGSKGTDAAVIAFQSLRPLCIRLTRPNTNMLCDITYPVKFFSDPQPAYPRRGALPCACHSLHTEPSGVLL